MASQNKYQTAIATRTHTCASVSRCGCRRCFKDKEKQRNERTDKQDTKQTTTEIADGQGNVLELTARAFFDKNKQANERTDKRGTKQTTEIADGQGNILKLTARAFFDKKQQHTNELTNKTQNRQRKQQTDRGTF